MPGRRARRRGARRATRTAATAEAVTAVKLARLRRLTAAWLEAHDVRPASVRIDVIAVTLPARGAAVVDHLVGVV